LQGHRGARGLAPENTLAGFAKALEIGVTTIETDLAVTKDGVLVLSHSPHLNPDITRGPDGEWLAPPTPPIHSLALVDLRRFDVGRIKPFTPYYLQFFSQVPADGSRIPTLQELFDFATTSGKKPRFNVETKISPDSSDTTPDPESFARLVVETVRRAGMTGRTTIQSFDWRTLLAAKRIAPEIETACLTSQTGSPDNIQADSGRASPWLAGLDQRRYSDSLPKLVRAAGCGTWLPFQRDLGAAAVKEAQALGLKVVPWTINSRSDMVRMIDMGVDGFITDYPDVARQIMKSKGISQL
jgi:glycerophosphoryl diester phosphodiesterase